MSNAAKIEVQNRVHWLKSSFVSHEEWRQNKIVCSTSFRFSRLFLCSFIRFSSVFIILQSLVTLSVRQPEIFRVSSSLQTMSKYLTKKSKCRIHMSKVCVYVCLCVRILSCLFLCLQYVSCCHELEHAQQSWFVFFYFPSIFMHFILQGEQRIENHSKYKYIFWWNGI